MKMILDYGIVDMPELEPMNSDTFLDFCLRNPDLNLELDQYGNILIMSPVFAKGSNFEAMAIGVIAYWNSSHGETGYVFSSQGGFTLPNGAVRVPDVAWVSKERMNLLPESEWQKFSRICPDFIIELRSKTDRLKPLQEKMQEYMDNGCLLGFLIDPYAQQAWIYRPESDPELTDDFTKSLSGEPVLPGFSLDLSLFNVK